MRVYVSADMEGIAAVTHREDVRVVPPHGEEYARARVQLTAEANAAVAGAFDAGATQVVVNDAHGDMRNLLPDRLDPRAELIRGPVKSGLMMAGIRDGFDAALLVGYHARAGESGVLSHTLNGRQLISLTLDEQPIGEIGVSTLLAGEAAVPVRFVSGDEAACAEARDLLGAGVETFATKTALDRITARCLSPARCIEGIHDGVRRALTAEQPAVRPRPGPVTVGCTWASTTAAQVASWVPGVELTGPATTRFRAPDVRAAVDLLVVLLFAAEGLEDA